MRNAARRPNEFYSQYRFPIPRLRDAGSLELAALEGAMIDTTERYLLLLAVGAVIVYVVLITPGHQLFMATCGGMIIGFALGNLIRNWRHWRER